MSPANPIRRDGLHARLRAATDPAHRALEAGLDWQARVATRAGYRDLLARLHGFHATWECAIGAELADEPFLAPRRRLALLAADLDHLGLAPAAVAALPRAVAIALDGPAAATGALYVLEGSTLGGQLISRALGEAAWAPAEGLRYFNPYGRRTAAMWGQFRTALDTAVPALDAEAVVEGARATFAALQAGLAPRLERAA